MQYHFAHTTVRYSCRHRLCNHNSISVRTRVPFIAKKDTISHIGRARQARELDIRIGVGRFRILGGGGGGARFRILGGAKGGGGQIPSRHMTSY